jgi:hypothetical protein
MPASTRSLHPRGQLVRDLVVRAMAPPDEHVRALEDVPAEALAPLVERRGADLERTLGVLADRRGDCRVHALWIELGDLRMLALVQELVPDGHADDLAHGPEL